MRISTLSTSNGQNYGFQDEKLSLRKLSQVKALNNVQYYQQRSSQVKPYHIIRSQMKPNYNITTPKQSHIRWVDDSEVQVNSIQIVNNNQPYNKPTLARTGKSPRRAVRRRIFENQYQQPKQSIYIPTFNNVPQSPYQPDQQTQYYSMLAITPKQQQSSRRQHNNNKPSSNTMNINIHQPKQYISPFLTNIQNSKHQQYNPSMGYSSRGIIEKSSISQLTEYHIPKLEQKLKEHDQELMSIKKYLKNAEKLNDLKDSIKEFQQVQSLTIRQEEIKNRRLLIMNQIASAKLRETQLRKLADQQANNTIQHIEEQRIKRLEKIKRENQQLKSNLNQINCPPSQSHINITNHRNDEYKFHGPIDFPSKDWDSQYEIVQPVSKQFERTDFSKLNVSYQKGYNTADLSVSPALKSKMHEISSIGFTNNKSFSLEGNTFREFTSPLDFQGENQPW